MYVPKCLRDFCTENNLNLIIIRYKTGFGYVKRRGFDLVNPKNNQIIASFEPINYSDKTKWFLRHVHRNYKGERYFLNLCKSALKNINPLESSFFQIKTELNKSI